ncbi:MAG: HNH endonuclease [Acidobacteriota bacterium]
MAPHFELEPHHRNVPNGEFVADLQRVARELGRSTVTIDQYNERGRFHASSLARRFGSWFKALEQAGLAKSRTLHISNDDLFQNLADIWIRLGRQPKYNDLTSQSSRFSNGTYENRFGGWRKALEAFVTWANEGEVHAVEPSVSGRLTRHRTSRNINYRLRFLVMRRDNFKCRITGRSPATDPTVILEVDHIIPWDKGGETVMENLQTLAKDINIGKSNLSMHHDG